MKRREFFKTASALAAALSVPVQMTMAQEKPMRILYFDRSTGYIHPPTIPNAEGKTVCGEALRSLGKKLGFEVDCTKDSAVFEGDLSKYDAFIFYTCGNLDQKGPDGSPGMSEKGIFNFYNAIRTGTGFVGIHSATDTWKTPGEGFENQPASARTGYINMIGGQFIVHGAQQKTTLRVADGSSPFLSTKGASFEYFDEWYTLKNFNPDLHVLLVQETAGMNIDGGNKCYNRPPYPCTWIRKEGEGRVAYMSLGHNNTSFWDETAEGIMSDLILMVTKKIDVDLTPNMDKVCPDASVLQNK